MTESPQPSPPPPARIAIHLQSDPTGAAVVLEDGTELGKTPLDWRVAPSDRTVAVSFKKDGYETRTHKLTLRQASEVKIDLPRVRRAVKPAPAPKRLDPKVFPTTPPPRLPPVKSEPPRPRPSEDDLMKPG